MNGKIATLVGLVLVSNVVVLASNHFVPASSVNCSSHVWLLGNCSSFVTNGNTTKKPEIGCCSGLKTVLNFYPHCLCEAFKQLDSSTANRTKFLSLPAACNVSAPSFGNCTFNGTGDPPGHSRALSRITYDTLRLSPTHGPTVALPPAHGPTVALPPALGPTLALPPSPTGSFGDYGDTLGYSGNYYTENNTSREPLKIGLPIVAIVIVILLVIGRHYNRKNPLNKANDNQNLDGLIKQYGFLAPKRYSYSEIKKMTNSLRDKLGEGGFGEVYKGTLIDGRPVAVKILKATKADGEDFVNEVVNISRTSHVNVVTLLGFCIDGKKRALVYEFMANGSLEKYIYKERISKSCTDHLGWERLYQIALGVARGLEYLHRGCNTRILHFDIKPHNILLDCDFCPKISDFGLAKQCARKESIISMIETRGTIGYIAPEVISRNFGGVSHKSDVYSYGMMLLEMVGGRKNICPQVSRTSEIYFPHWAYQRMVVGEDLKLQGVTTGEEDEIAKKMIIVGLWCIQNDPSQRPAMSKVIEMLEGSLSAMEIPPKPFFGSPSRSGADSCDRHILEDPIEV